MIINQLNDYLSGIKKEGLYRQRQVIDVSGGNLLFSSNDYLSLADDPQVKQAYQVGFARYPSGSGGSMVVCGYHSAHQTLEKAFAAALGVDDCLLFSSGFAANLSVISMLAHAKASVLIDKAVHASIYDGLKLSGANYVRYRHHELADAALKMQTMPDNTVVMTESIFSMSGQITPLVKMNKLVKSHQYELLVDEAHAFGITGREGLGAVVEAGLTQDDVPLRVLPFGKAFGAQGAIVAGQGAWVDAILQSARPYIYSTAISPALAHGMLETLTLIRRADERREKLTHLVRYFREAIKSSPLQWRDSHTPIQQLQLGCPHRALSYAAKLREQSIICLPIRQPTVSKLETGLRIILNYNHQPEHIDRLFKCLI